VILLQFNIVLLHYSLFMEASKLLQLPDCYNTVRSLFNFINFLSWLLITLTNSHLPDCIPLGSILFLGAAIQILPHIIGALHALF
jgi:hypothetical protein